MLHDTTMNYRLLLSLCLIACVGLTTACDPDDTASNNATPGQNNDNNQNNAMDMGMDQSGEDMPEDMLGDQSQTVLTYYKDVKPIIHRNCEKCHLEGGAGPYAMDSYDNLKKHAQLAVMAIDSGEMPPWSPDPDCRNFKAERIMTADEIATFKQWIDQGMAEGEASDWQAPEVGMTPMPDKIGKQSASYTPSKTRVDDYRCFLIDLEFDKDTFVTGTTVVPGNDKLVHHANLFLVNPAHTERVEQLEQQDDTGGYRCFGDAGINQTSLVGAWVPGSQPIFMPEDTAILIGKGSRLVLQVHYNTLYSDPEPVNSEVLLYTTEQPPKKVARAMPIANLNFEVPPGEKESSHSIFIRNSSDKPWKVIGTAPHLHLLATKVKVEVLPKDPEADPICLIDIPKWDFEWQQEYRFKDDQWVDVQPGDRVKLTCVFDNSPENQPYVDGKQLTPQTIGWGGGTNDEMCLNFLVVVEDYDPTAVSGPLCEPFKQCRKQCEDQYSVGCIFNCATVEIGCGECLLFGAQDCAGQYCRRELRNSASCLVTCAQGAQAGGDIDGCLKQECPTERDALETCMRPYIEQGLCNEYVKECNVAF